MSTITFQCDKCQQQIDLLEKPGRLNHVGKCTITKLCNGFLYKIKRNPNNVRTNVAFDATNQTYEKRNIFRAYTQVVPNTIWRFSHTLGKSVVVTIFDEKGSSIPITEYILNNDGNTILITFSAPRRGYVHVVSRTNNKYYEYATPSLASTTQLSGKHLITFAIPNYISRYDSGADKPPISFNPPLNICDASIKLEVEVNRPNSTTVYCYEDLKSINNDYMGAWYNWDKILVRNRKQYCLRFLDLNHLRSLTPIYSNESDIINGTQIRFTKISYDDGEHFYNIPDKGLLILLSNEPYKYSDKILDKFVDCGEIVGTNNDYFTFLDKELYANTATIETTFPIITQSKY